MPAANGAPEREVLESAVRDAGALALKTFRGSLRQWLKGGSSPVSEADIAVDALLHERLRNAFPTHGWLSEETEDDASRLEADSVWIVDPIDGTRAYLEGKEDWVVSVALARAGRPRLGAVFAPVSDEFFLAEAGAGATRNGEPIHVKDGSGFEGARLLGPKKFAGKFADVHPGIVPLPRIGSLAMRLARVAHGGADVTFVSGNSHDWDLAAADLLVHESGGLLTDVQGQRLIYNRPEPKHGPLVASGRSRHALMLELLRTRKAQFA